jgi:uncharacterized protein YecE (DUF72 family)
VGTVYVGTTGYSHKDWLGPFYPRTLRPGDFLSYYADFFATCELSHTYHRMPDAVAFRHLVEKSERRIQFVVKLHQDLSQTDAPPAAALAAFRQALAPLRDAGVLGGVIAQYPYAFGPDARGKDHVKRLREAFGSIPLVAELRNGRWFADEGLRFLRRQGVALCCVDEPKLDGLLPPLEVVTSEVAYVRFHGRNAERWWRHTEPSERYHYAYADDELGEWAARLGRMARQAERVYAVLGNHVQANAVHDARRLLALLAGAGVSCAASPAAPAKALSRRIAAAGRATAATLPRPVLADARLPASAAVRPQRSRAPSRPSRARPSGAARRRA